MTWMLILFSLLPAGPGLDMPATVKTELGPYATYEQCLEAKRKAARAVKRMQMKHTGAACVQRRKS